MMDETKSGLPSDAGAPIHTDLQSLGLNRFIPNVVTTVCDETGLPLLLLAITVMQSLSLVDSLVVLAISTVIAQY